MCTHNLFITGPIYQDNLVSTIKHGRFYICLTEIKFKFTVFLDLNWSKLHWHSYIWFCFLPWIVLHSNIHNLFSYMYAILVFLELYMFQYLMLCTVYLFSAGCMTALACFDPNWDWYCFNLIHDQSVLAIGLHKYWELCNQVSFIVYSKSH